jgi:uncharacterized membrane protein YfcA
MRTIEGGWKIIDGLLLIILLFVLSFTASFLDAAIGIGYGTLLTPLLIFLNLSVLDIVPAVLFAQIVAAAITALFYYLHGNVEFTRTSDDSKIAITLSLAGILGASIAITLFYTLFYINPQLLQIYIALALLLVGLLVLLKIQRHLTHGQIFALGAIAAVNKGLSGGGYTPILTGGLMLSGRNNKQAIGATKVAKAVTSLTAVLLYILLGRLIFDVSFINLIVPLTIGTLFGAPLASYLVKRTPSHRLTLIIGVTITLLGVFTLFKTIINPWL